MNGHYTRNRQRGVALAFGLIFLVIITLIGVAAMRVTTSQTLQASNYQFKTQTFQAAESGIHTVMEEIRGVIDAPLVLDDEDEEVLDEDGNPVREGNILIAAISSASSGQAGPSRSFPTDFSPPNLAADGEPPTPGSLPEGSLSSQVTLTSDNPDGLSPPIPGFSLSGKTTLYRFTIRATSDLANTNARSDHQQGVARLGPKP